MSANMKPPAGRNADWPPKGFTRDVHVGTSRDDNWWSIARAVGRDNPWDLIIYNFDTEDAQEVNYYLKEYVGCHKLNGSNFSFHGASPGRIYIPPTSWRPAAKYKKGSSSRNYPDYLAHRVAPIISRAASVCPYVVSGFGHRVTGNDLYRVAEHVRYKRIGCAIAPELRYQGELGHYHAGDDEFTFKREPRNGVLADVATIAHESVHAALDANRAKKLNFAANEMLAFAVEAIATARLFPSEVERRLSIASHTTPHPDHDLLLFGWAAPKVKRLAVDLDNLRTVPAMDDPFRGFSVKLYDILYRYVRARYRPLWNDITITNGIAKAGK